MTVVGSVRDTTHIAFGAGVAVIGNYAYVANQTQDRVTAVDISNPASPRIVTSITDTRLDFISSIVADGTDMLYVTAQLADDLVSIQIS